MFSENLEISLWNFEQFFIRRSERTKRFVSADRGRKNVLRKFGDFAFGILSSFSLEDRRERDGS